MTGQPGEVATGSATVCAARVQSRSRCSAWTTARRGIPLLFRSMSSLVTAAGGWLAAIRREERERERERK
jgi:hypothetical protein